jgi:hypothetical protein
VGRASGQGVRPLRKENRHCSGRSPFGIAFPILGDCSILEPFRLPNCSIVKN